MDEITNQDIADSLQTTSFGLNLLSTLDTPGVPIQIRLVGKSADIASNFAGVEAKLVKGDDGALYKITDAGAEMVASTATASAISTVLLEIAIGLGMAVNTPIILFAAAGGVAVTGAINLVPNNFIDTFGDLSAQGAEALANDLEELASPTAEFISSEASDIAMSLIDTVELGASIYTVAKDVGAVEYITNAVSTAAQAIITEAGTGNEYIVKTGDSLWNIAKALLNTPDGTPATDPQILQGVKDLLAENGMNVALDGTVTDASGKNLGNINDVVALDVGSGLALPDNMDTSAVYGNANPESINGLLGDVIDDLGVQKGKQSPIVLDLDGDGIELISHANSTTYFDLNSNDFATRTGWIGADDGLLAIDNNANGKIDNSSELFSVSGYNSTLNINNYDINIDGKLTSADTDWTNLLVWTDINGNGISESAELFTMASLNITEIGLSFTSVSNTIEGNSITDEGTFVINGMTQDTADVWFTNDDADSTYVGDVALTWELLSMPTLRGYGEIPDLHIAMSLDSTLKDAVDDYLVNYVYTTGTIDKVVFEDIMYQWAGVQDVAAGSRGEYVDARKLEFIEKYTADDFIQNGSPNPASQAGIGLENLFQQILDSLTLRIAAQTTESDIYSYNHLKDEVTDNSGNILTGLVISGTEAADTMIGDEDDNLIIGREGDDIISGLDGNDTLIGSAGNDTLNGGNGDDTYLFNIGDGQDTIHEFLGVDSIKFGIGITKVDVTFGQNVNDLVITIGAGGDSITLQDWFISANDQVETFVFADGLKFDNITVATILANGGVIPADLAPVSIGSSVIANELADSVGLDIATPYDPEGDILTITVTAIPNSIDGTVTKADGTTVVSVNDTLTTEELTNLLFHPMDGQTGTFIFSYDVTSNNITTSTSASIEVTSMSVVNGTVGNDRVYGINGTDNLLSGLEGSDRLYGKNSQDDILIGDEGNDYLYGYTGNDTYRYSLGDGSDKVYEKSGAGGFDVVEFDSSITPNDVTYVRSGNHLEIHISDGGKLTVQNMYYSTPREIEEVRFTNGTVHTKADISIFISNIGGTAGNDTLYGFDGVNLTMVGLEGDDRLYGRNGDDLIQGNDGADILDGGQGEDIISGGLGNDNLLGDAGNDILLGDVGNDDLKGDAGNDMLTGGTGSDSLRGGSGDDVYFFSMGDGVDTIYESSNSVTDTVIFDATITVADVDYSRVGNNMVLTIGTGGDSVSIHNWFYGTAPQIIEEFRFADGTIHTANDAVAFAYTQNGTSGDDTLNGVSGAPDVLNGLDGNDTLNGADGDDTLNGGNGNDILNGMTGDDILDGGAGNDTLKGYLGNDTYHFSSGFGVDTIDDISGTDAVIFDSTITVADVSYSRSGDDLVATVGTSGDELNFFNWFHSVTPRVVEEVRFDDGTIHTPTYIADIVATTGNDTLTGSDILNDNILGLDGDDIITGGNGDDTLYGNAGNDSLDGGLGIDILNGGAGDDTLIYDNLDSSIDGGIGIEDILIIDSSTGATSVDLSDTALAGLENIDMTDTESTDKITLTEADVLRISDDDTLHIFGDAGDDVESATSWTRGTDVTEGATTFASYTSGTAALYIQLGLDLNGTEIV